jgi:hypothetical protein
MSDDKIKETSASSTDDTMLTDFKVAAHALLDAIELGLFKRVKVKSDGSVLWANSDPVTASEIRFRRFSANKDTFDIYASIKKRENGDYTEFKLEDLVDMKGLFLDERDAQKIIMLRNIERIKERKRRAEEEAKQHDLEIQAMQVELLKLDGSK